MHDSAHAANTALSDRLVSELIARNYAQRDGQLLIGDLPVTELVARFDTPLYLYDAAVLARRLHQVQSILPERSDLFYSVKANPNLQLLRYLVRNACGLEVASAGELYLAQQAGCPGARIVFAGPGKTVDELQWAVAAEVGQLHVESLLELQRLEAIASQAGRRQPVALRVNPASGAQGGALRMGATATPFGLEENQLDLAVQRVESSRWLQLTGVHLYLGTQILDAGRLQVQYATAMSLARRIVQQIGRPLETIDLGGGWGVPYFAADQPLDLGVVAEILGQLAQEKERDPMLADTRLILELGRYLVAESGIYVTRVNDIKTSHGKTFLVIDGGMHQHLAASGNLGQVIRRNFPVALLNRLDDQPASNLVDVVGPLCTPLDVLGRGVRLPAAAVGDLLGVFQSGAYARTASPLGFLSHPGPAEVWVEKGQASLIRRRGTPEDLLADQPPFSAG